MADICPVCDKKIWFFIEQPQRGIFTHPACQGSVLEDPEKYGGTVKTEAERKTYVKLQQKMEEKGVHVKSFDMPFMDMVGFMVKWALASIPAFIILVIIGAIFFAVFGSLFS